MRFAGRMLPGSGAGPFTEGDKEYMAVYRHVIKLPSFLAVPEDPVFLDLASELNRQGVSRKVTCEACCKICVTAVWCFGSVAVTARVIAPPRSRSSVCSTTSSAG